MRVAFTLLLTLATLALSAPASAVTVRDIIELTKAGLSDDLLVDLIDADRTIFTLDREQILDLKAAGVSDTVLRKMLRSRREFEPPPAETPGTVTGVAEAPPPEVIVIREPAPEPVTVIVPQYYYLPVPIWGIPSPHAPRVPAQPVLAPQYRGFGRFINDGWVERR